MYDTFLSATTARVDGAKRTVEITLQDGQVYECSLADASERLRLVHPSLLEDWEWIGPRAGMHWPAVDEDLSIGYLVAKGTRRNGQDATTRNPETTHLESLLTTP